MLDDRIFLIRIFPILVTCMTPVLLITSDLYIHTYIVLTLIRDPLLEEAAVGYSMHDVGVQSIILQDQAGQMIRCIIAQH